MNYLADVLKHDKVNVLRLHFFYHVNVGFSIGTYTFRPFA